MFSWITGRAEADGLGARLPRAAYEITGQVKLVPTWPAAKIVWLRRHEPDVVARTAKFLLIEDYFLHRLTGEYVCEGSLVTSTCYWNFKTRQWWPEMLAALEIRDDQLPRLCESGVPVGQLRPEVAEELGLSPHTIACTGALDLACGAIGVGNIGPGIFSENTGAALAICATVPHPTLDPNNQMPCHYHGLPGLYMLHTFTGGGIVMRWFRDEFASLERLVGQSSGQDAYDLLGMEAARVPPGCEGLVMLPRGARWPRKPILKQRRLLWLHLAWTGSFCPRHHGGGCHVRRNIEMIEDWSYCHEVRASAVARRIETDRGRYHSALYVLDRNEELPHWARHPGGKAGLCQCRRGRRPDGRSDRFEPSPVNTQVYEETYHLHRRALCHPESSTG